jgi:trehalose synthase
VSALGPRAVPAVRTLDHYAEPAGPEVVEQLQRMARPLKGARVVHVNSTRVGGGVAEILAWLVPLMNDLGIETSWEVVHGDAEFFRATKAFHNGLQGDPVRVAEPLLKHYEDVNRENADRLRETLEDADFVLIHDPQPAALIAHFPDRAARWIWRCHIDVSRPSRPIWKFLRQFVSTYDASVASLPAFAQPLGHPQYIIAPGIDPLSEKNREMSPAEMARETEPFGLDPDRPLIVQVSRFDRFKDPLGVIRAFRLVRPHLPLQLVLAGGTADDDPEGAAVLSDVLDAVGEDPDVRVLALPPDAHTTINALQRRADLVVQKSLREGFGLTVTEAMWKGKPVIGGDTGGIRLQVFNFHTGFLVHTPEGAAFRIRYLLNRPDTIAELGTKARRLVRENFLLTRQLREYLTLLLALKYGARERLLIA